MIEFRNVRASYEPVLPILEDVSFSIADGEFVAFVGSNGAGKSTTMRLMNGLLKPAAGEVLIDGRSTRDLATSELAARVGFLFQNPDSQICNNTVRDELLFGFKAQGRLDDEARKRVDETIEQFGFDADADPFLLNRGSRQLLALASVVVLEPAVVVLDEPTTGLDYRECEMVMSRIAQMNERGTTVVMVSHDMEVVADYAKRLVVMAEGRVVDDGAVYDVLRRTSTLEAASLMPPQVVQVSMAIGQEPGRQGSAIAQANTVDEMVAACKEEVRHV